MSGPLVLLYHDVLQNTNDTSGFGGKDADGYKLPFQLFRKQVKAIAASQYPAIFSFDDGGVSCYETIAPLLEQYHFNGLFFIPTAFIGKPGFLSAEHIKELHQRGHIIGSHSHTHRPLAYFPYEEVLKEWRTSSDILSNITESLIPMASLPGGWYSDKVAKAAAEAGIKTLYTSEPTLSSFEVHGCKVKGRFNIESSSILPELLSNTRTQKQLHLQWERKEKVKKLFGRWYLQIRRLIK